MSDKENVIVMQPPNTAPPMVEVWAFVSRDRDGNENTIGSTGLATGLGMQPFITGNARIADLMREYVREHRADLEAGGRQTIHLLHFTGREEVEL